MYMVIIIILIAYPIIIMPLDGDASLLLWRAMGTGVLKPGRLFPIWPRACPLA